MSPGAPVRLSAYLPEGSGPGSLQHTALDLADAPGEIIIPVLSTISWTPPGPTGHTPGGSEHHSG